MKVLVHGMPSHKTRCHSWKIGPSRHDIVTVFVTSFPRGSKYPILEVSGSKERSSQGFGYQRPKKLATKERPVCPK